MIKALGKIAKKEIYKEKYYSFLITDSTSIYPTKINVSEETYKKYKDNDEIDMQIIAFANQTKDKSKTYVSYVEKTR